MHVACGHGSVFLWPYGGVAIPYVLYIPFVVVVMFSHSGLVARRVYSYATTEHDEHNSRHSKQILLNDKDRKYSLWYAHLERSLLYVISLFR